MLSQIILILRIFLMIICNPVKASKSKLFGEYNKKIMKNILLLMIFIITIDIMYRKNMALNVVTLFYSLVFIPFAYGIIILFIKLERFIVNKIITIDIPKEIYRQLIFPYIIVGFILSLILNIFSKQVLLDILFSFAHQVWFLVQRYLIIINRLGKSYIIRKRAIMVLCIYAIWWALQIVIILL